MDSFSVLAGFILGAIGLLIVGGIIFMFYAFNSASLTRKLFVTHITGGKPSIEIVKAKVIDHQNLGKVYLVPKWKNEGKSPFIQYFGGEYEYPISAKKFLVPITANNGDFAPMSFEFKEKVKLNKIIETISEKGAKTYDLKQFEVEQFILKTTRWSTRQFAIQQAVELPKEFESAKNFWEQVRSIAVSGIILIVVAFVGVFILIMASEAGKNILSSPAIIDGIKEGVVLGIEALRNTTAPPAIG